jgi:signal transduction histidine kinase/DNA-binding response OmpR family regulator
MKKIVWLGAFLFAGLACQGQSKKPDSLRSLLINHASEDDYRVNLLNEFSFRIFKREPDEALKYAQDALALSTRIHYSKGELMAKNNLAIYYLMRGKSELALDLVFGAVRIAEREHYPDLLADSYSIIGTVYHSQLQFEKAVEFLNKGLHVSGHKSNAITESRIYNALGGVARDKKKYDSALIYYQKGLSIMEQAHEDYRTPEILNNIGIVYLRQGMIDLSLQYFNKSLKEAEATENKRAKILALINIGNVLIEKKKYEEAEKIESNALVLAKEMGDTRKVLQIYLSLGTIKMETGKYHDAQLFMHDHYNLKDSLLNEEKTRQIAEIEAKYESEKKDQTILTLEKEKQIQYLKQIFLLFGLLIAIGTFVLIYFLQKKNSNKVKTLLDIQRSLNHKLQDTDELKSRFFANISHEFRTPLSLILAPIEAKLRTNDVSGADKESFQLISRNANRLLSLVNQLLDLSKLEAGKMELQVSKGDLTNLLKIIAASFDSLAENRKIIFQKNISINSNENWYDVDKLEKIINNLLSNAFKFTPPGGSVLLNINRVAEAEELNITIGDTGKGIANEDKPFVFFPFYQSKHINENDQPGTGLGLSLVHELVKIYGGMISLKSILNEGTTISVSLPISKNKFAQTSIAEELPLLVTPIPPITYFDGIPHESIVHREYDSAKDQDIEPEHTETLLIVEDNDDLRNFISSIFEDRYTIVTAKDGEEGFTTAIEQIPDLIISDVMMPKSDGIELTQKIKADERTSHIPIVLLTAKADLPSRLDGFKMGADDYIAKPFVIEEMFVRVANLIKQRKKLALKYMEELSIPNPGPTPPHTASLDEKFLLRAKQIVEKNISNSGFGVEQMAEEILLSRAQLFRKLKAITGLSPNEFINDIRLQTAADLIRAKADTLTQISYSVGYSEQSYFAKRFRKKFGVAPSEYNKIVKQDI